MLFPTQKYAIAVCSGRSDGAVERAVRLRLVQVLRVLLACQRRRRRARNCDALLEQERAHRREPRRLHGLTGLQLPLPGQDRPDPAVARRRRVETVAGAEGDDVLRRGLAERDAVRDVSAQRCDVRGVLGIDGRLLVGQVVVERRPRGRRDCRLHRGVRARLRTRSRGRAGSGPRASSRRRTPPPARTTCRPCRRSGPSSASRRVPR